MNICDNIKSKLQTLPNESGVYLMIDNDECIIYVGKAISLKNRVRQYFHSSVKNRKVEAMIFHIADFRYILTRNEVEALILENNLIKEHKPKYNILLKDDKSYPFIRIDKTIDYPKIEIVRKLPQDKALYFGPFMQGISINDIMDVIAAAFPLRTCKQVIVGKKSRACLMYHLGRCLAPCEARVTREEYHQVIDKVIAFLKGDSREVEERINIAMNKASEQEDFESAIYFRNCLKALNRLVREQVASLPINLNADGFAYITSGNASAISMISIRGGRMLGGNNYIVEDSEQSEAEALSIFIRQYYHDGRLIPNMILTSNKITDPLDEWFQVEYGKKVIIRTPNRGTAKKIIDITQMNASHYLDRMLLTVRADEKKRNTAEELSIALNLPSAHRIECYDISNISGTDKVASMVVFVDGIKMPAHYRRFRIKTVEGSDDFASMAEVIERRCKHFIDSDKSFKEIPDLVVIDGGKGQLNAANLAALRVGVNLHMVGLAKKEELIYKVGISEPTMLLHTSSAHKLITNIRDEAHRFAVTYHRKLRADRMTRSTLMEIDGIGATKVNILYRVFLSLDGIREASIESLNAVAGISLRDATNIQLYFNGEKNEL